MGRNQDFEEKWLEKAAAWGYRDAAVARWDADLTSLRNEAAFDRIVASAEGQEWMGTLDKLFDRLSRQVRRSRSQAVDHKKEPSTVKLGS